MNRRTNPREEFPSFRLQRCHYVANDTGHPSRNTARAEELPEELDGLLDELARRTGRLFTPRLIAPLIADPIADPIMLLAIKYISFCIIKAGGLRFLLFY